MRLENRGYLLVQPCRNAPPRKPPPPLIPESPSLDKLRRAAAGCQACPLWKTGTQTVFGEMQGRPGPGPRVMFVGEQPGDQEDKAGRPFVGPSGKRRLHAKPNAGEIRACLPWLEAGVGEEAPAPM